MSNLGRVTQFQQTHYFRKTVLFSDAQPVSLGILPRGAIPKSVDAIINIAFNAGTTNVITVGSNSSTYNNMVASGTITPATPAGYVGVAATVLNSLAPYISAAAQNLLTTEDTGTEVFINFTQTGTAATTGSVTVVLTYIPNNDQ
jgi:hypothetical protein